MAKKNPKADAPGVQRDDALFETLGKNKRRKKRKIILTVISIVLVLAIVAVVGVTIAQKRVREQFASNQGEVKSYEVSTGSISTVVSGSGSLTDVDLETVTVPTGVEITEVLVKPNQTVTAGDILAKVEMSSVVSAMADLQSQIEELDKQLKVDFANAAAKAPAEVPSDEPKKEDKKKVEVEYEDVEHGSKFLTILAVIIALILIMLLAVILILQIAPDSAAAAWIDSLIESITARFSMLPPGGGQFLL